MTETIDPAERWNRVRLAFARISELPEGHRAGELAALPPDIGAEVESLLHAVNAVPNFLRTGDQEGPGVGSDLGPYRLLSEIGRGGMGIVFRAERRDGEYSKHVAIKLATGRGFGPESERRLIQERQILAQLDHPNIVRLLDGGVLGHQRYFVMELAEGEPLTDHCRSRRLPLAERLRMFCQVCAAIQYAHQRLILHRDIKPTNVVVTSDREVKVLDFGIAQLLEADGAAAGSETVMHPFSLAGASPEQLRGERLSLASDVYSLGVLLFELVSDVSPQNRAAGHFDDVYREVVNELPPSPRRLAGRVPRDVDAIVRKSMAALPAERYASVAELEADVNRFLTGRPVLAVPPSAAYVLTRFIKRNKALSATAAVLIAVVLAAAIIYIRQAELERRRLADATQLVHSVIFDIQPKLEGMANALPIRQALIQETMRYLESASRDAGRDVALLHELSNAYRELARLQGDLTTSSLGALAPAAERFQRADALMQKALAVAPSDPALLKDAAVLYSRMAAFESNGNRGDAALAHARMAVTFADRNVRARPADDLDARELQALTTFSLALTLPATNWLERVETFKHASDHYQALTERNPSKDALHRNLSTTLRYVASLHADKGHLAEAVSFGRRALDVVESLLARQPSSVPLQLDVATSAGVLAAFVEDTGNVAEADRLYGRAVALNEQVLQTDAANARARLLLADATRGLAATRLASEDVVDARRHAARAVDLFSSLQANGQFPASSLFRVAQAYSVLGNVANRDGNDSHACAAFRKARDLYDEMDRQSPLVDSLRADADAARATARGCDR